MPLMNGLNKTSKGENLGLIDIWSVERTLTENIDISKRSKIKEQRNGDSI